MPNFDVNNVSASMDSSQNQKKKEIYGQINKWV